MFALRFWPVIDDALRRASLERGVEIRIMASWWNHSNPDMVKYLNSLAALSGAMKAKVSVVGMHGQFNTPTLTTF